MQWLSAKAVAPFCEVGATTAYRCGGSAGSLGDSLHRLAPASRFTVAVQQGLHDTISAKQSNSAPIASALPQAKVVRPIARDPGDTIARMLEDLEALRAKLTELNARVRHLREENQQLRMQLAGSQGELNALRQRVGGALDRVDSLLAALPGAPAADADGPATGR